MQGWPQHQRAGLIARAKAVMAKLCLKLKRLFVFSKQSQAAECLLLLEYQPAQSTSELVPVEASVEISVCDHTHAKPKRGSRKEPCPHCGRPFGKQPDEITKQYLREKREKQRAERERLKMARREAMGLPLAEETIKKEPKTNKTEIDRPKPYNVRCPKCKRLIKQPFEVVGDAAYQSAQKKISDALQQEFAKPEGKFCPLVVARQHNDAWLLTLAIPYLKAADAALRNRPSFSDGQPIQIIVPWTPPPRHFVAPSDEDWRSWAELRDYKLKEKRLKALEKRGEARKAARREITQAAVRTITESLPKRRPEIYPPNGPRIRMV